MSRILIRHPEQNDVKLKQMNISLCALLDTQHPNMDKTFTVRMRIIYDRKPKYYSTKVQVTQEQFSAIATGNPRRKLKESKTVIFQLLKKANDLILENDYFSFDNFERSFFHKFGDAENLFNYYQKMIEEMKKTGRLGTASNYEYSLNSLKNYLKNKSGKEPQRLLFREITPDFLNQYEYYMIHEMKKSITTVGIYLRPLRALFNMAISDGVIKRDIYPFGRRKYEIPAPRAVKKALTKDELRQLYEAKPRTTEQKKARDFWFFLFNCAGLNIKDLARLKYKNVQENTLVYFREKTKRTSKAHLEPVVVYLNEYSRKFIEKYGNPDWRPGNYIFCIYDEFMSEEEKFRRAGNFTRFINQNIKKLARANGLPEEISSYWSRHSFATNAIRNGATMEQVSQALNHHDLSTTENYFAGFEDETMKRIADNLMNF